MKITNRKPLHIVLFLGWICFALLFWKTIFTDGDVEIIVGYLFACIAFGGWLLAEQLNDF